MDDAVVDGVGQDRVTNLVLPAADAELGAEDSGGDLVPRLNDDLPGLVVVQMHGGAVFGDVFAVVLVELRGLVRHIPGQPALLHVFQPEQVQRDALALHLPVHAFIVRHPVFRLARNARIQNPRQLLIRHVRRKRPAQPALRRSLQCIGNRVPGAAAARSDLRLVQPHTVQSQYLPVVGHTHDLPIMSSKKYDRIEVFSLAVQTQTSHKPWISKYQVRE